MTQTILKAVMRLMAIVAHICSTDNNKIQKQIVESFLKYYVREKEVMQYIMMFDFHLKSLKQKDKDVTDKKVSVYSVKNLIICEEINLVMEKKQKAVMLLFLLELAYSSPENFDLYKEFLLTISDAIKIENEDFENISLFALNRYKEINDKTRILLILNSPIKGYPNQLINENLQGKIIVLQLISANIYVFRHIDENDMLYLNNREVEINRSYIFEKGSLINSPKIAPVYYSEIVQHFIKDETLQDFSLSTQGVEFYFKNSENGIQNINFSAVSGQLIGIMGGSGVGKSTFLNVLNGSLKPNFGKVLINGFDIYKEPDKVEGLIGFIPQDDLLIEELTVYQNLYFNARLCFKKLSVEEIQDLVIKTLRDLGLFYIKDLKVGSPLNKFISGGQRKRLNIALELIREPYILLVDEPTSGLSSHDSEIVMDMFKEQALKGKIIIINIHQPSSNIFKQFDKLLVFDKGGRPVYYGNPVESVVYFKSMSHLINATESECLSCGNVNPEQVLEIIEDTNVDEYGYHTDIRKVTPEQWFSMYKKNIESKIDVPVTKKDLPKNQFSIPGTFNQFKIFTLRNILTKLSDQQYLLINLLEAPLLAFILGFFTKHIVGTSDNPGQYIFGKNENIPAYLFMSIIVALFLGMMVSAEEIIRDRKILKRESFLNLSWSSYLNSKIVILFIISAVQTFTFLLIGNWMLEIKGMFMSYWIILFSVSCAANLMGLNISASLKSVVSIYITIPLLLVPQILFAGVIVKFDKLHKLVTSQEVVPVIGDLMVSRWAYEALAVNQFKNNKYEKFLYEVEKEESNAAFKLNYYIPELITKTLFCKKYHNNPNYRSLVSKELKIISDEIQNIINTLNDADFTYYGSLTISSFNEEVANLTIKYLSEIKRKYSKILEDRIYQKDNLIINLIKNYGDKEKFFEFKNKYYNESLADQVLNKMEKQKITEGRGLLIQKAEPIFKLPYKNNGRSHFYSPSKKFAGIYFNTLLFNVMIIWVMILLMYIMLQYNAIIWLINQGQKIKYIKNFFIKRYLSKDGGK